MHKITLDIGNFPEASLVSHPSLIAELSPSAFNYMIVRGDKSLQKIRYYQVDISNDAELPATLEQIFASDELLGNKYEACYMVYNFAANQLIPEKYYNENINRQLLETIHGDLVKGVILNERVNDLQAQNIYRVSGEVHALIADKFPSHKQHHYDTLLLDHLYQQQDVETDKVVVAFYRKNIIAIVVKNNKLQLIQRFAYQTSEDVAYWLLNIYQQFNLEQLATPLLISGMINEESAMHNELLKYFAKLEFEKHPEYIKDCELLNGYPKHFFSPILKLATCVL